ncbi:MAG TPA: hypothetical protein VIV57_01110 [Anaeromyxobacter sp.]
MKKLWLASACSIAFALPAVAEDSLARFEGGIGVVPVSSVAGTQNANGTFPDVNRNDVRGTPPGGQPWVIASLSVDVKTDGRVSAVGRGLLLAGGNGIGTNGAQTVQARLFCGNAQFNSGLVALEANGDFRIDDVLTPAVPEVCDSAVLLIVNSGGRWFAAGIPKL